MPRSTRADADLLAGDAARQQIDQLVGVASKRAAPCHPRRSGRARWHGRVSVAAIAARQRLGAQLALEPRFKSRNSASAASNPRASSSSTRAVLSAAFFDRCHAIQQSPILALKAVG